MSYYLLFIALGGEGGIRTPDTLASMPHFECGAFNHSATSPEPETGLCKARNGRRYVAKRAKTDKGRRAYIGCRRRPAASSVWQWITPRHTTASANNSPAYSLPSRLLRC